VWSQQMCVGNMTRRSGRLGPVARPGWPQLSELLKHRIMNLKQKIYYEP